MTTSNPVVPRFETVVQPSAPEIAAGSRKVWHGPKLNLWPASDFIAIALVFSLFRQAFAPIVPDSVRLVVGDSLSASLLASGCILLFSVLGLYSPCSSPLEIRETERLVRGVSIIGLLAVLRVTPLSLRLGGALFLVLAFTAVLLVIQRDIARRLLRSHHDPPRTLIYVHRADTELLKIIRTLSGHTLEFVGLLHDSRWEFGLSEELPGKFVGVWDDLSRAATQTKASDLLIVGCDPAMVRTLRMVERCADVKLRCSILMDPRSPPGFTPTVTFIHELPICGRPNSDTPATTLPIKRAFDIVVGSLLLLLTLPIGLLVAVVIACDSRGPLFFHQKRIGKDGRPFVLLKFRTMQTWAPRYHRSPTSDADPRITRIGRLLRRLSLDELPQLVNVLKGDMSLVGPRPEMPFIVDQYNHAARARLTVRPGITGLWQVSRARSMPIHHNLHYDLFYINNQNIFVDIAILLRTLGAVIRGIGAA